MPHFIFRRLLSMIPLLLGISLVVFFLMYLAPGDFLDEARHSKDVNPDFIRQQEMALGLDKPWYIQYAMWLNNVSFIKTNLLLPASESAKHSLIYFGSPDFGYSWAYKISATSLIWQRLPATLILALVSSILTYLIAIPLGVLAAVKKDSFFDKICTILSYASLSVPYFFLALLAVLFAATTGLFPTGGQTSITYEFMPVAAKIADYSKHLILPTLVLSLGGIASVMRVMRGNFLDYQRAEFATTARAKGLSENAIMFKHVLRNAINPIITSFGFAFSGLLSGALLVENVMNYPGLGQLIYTAIIKQDQYVVMSGVLMGCIMLVLGQLLADILLAWADPRIRLENSCVPFKQISLVVAFSAILIVVFSIFINVFPNFSVNALPYLKNFAEFLFILLVVLIALGLIWAGYFFFKNLFFSALKTSRGFIAITTLFILYFFAIFAPFIAPYEETTQCLEKTLHPPTALTFQDGTLSVKVYHSTSITDYQPLENQTLPIKFFVKSNEYKLLWLFKCSTKLFGLDSKNPADRIYLLGSDASGRDVFSRLLYGAQISLSIGFVGIAITMFIGFIVGGLSGYFGGTFDFLCMRFVEFLMAVPGLYILLAMRSAFAANCSSDEVYFRIIVILSVLGWAGTARVIRGMALSLSNRQFVQVAESMGQSPIKIIFKHFLPNVLSFLIVSATLSIPGYILGEAALSFLGLGIGEPSASWGLMLAQAQEDTKVLMLGLWWLLLPGAAIFVTVLAFNMLGDVLRDIADPKQVK